MCMNYLLSSLLKQKVASTVVQPSLQFARTKTTPPWYAQITVCETTPTHSVTRIANHEPNAERFSMHVQNSRQDFANETASTKQDTRV